MRENREGYERFARELVRESRREYEALARESRERYEELRRENREELQLTREVVRRNEIAFQGVQEVLAELVAEVRAMREGVFALIDELRRNGPDPATT